ncbi:sulfotransferase 1C4 [Trichonephila clavata]|nr:sulfotransferase 1C4 [Trichonephila clavata]
MSKPRLFKTHLPFEPLKYNPEAKYIYVTRHPADLIVSYYHHLRFFAICFFTDGTLEVVLNLFMLNTFESIKSDHRGACLKIAHFLGEEYHKHLLDDDEALLKKVLEYSSVEYMKATVNEFWKDLLNVVPSEEHQKRNPVMKKAAEILQEAKEKGLTSKGMFIRKGMAGEGKESLSEAQLDRLKEHIRNRTVDSEVMSLWNNI